MICKESLNKSNMKKSILFFCTVLIAFSVMAVGYMNWNNAEVSHGETNYSSAVVYNFDFVNPIKKLPDIDLVYKVDSRFDATITRENLHKAKSVVDIVPKKSEWSKVSFLNMKVAVLQDEGEIIELGENEVLNAAQVRLLQSLDYSNHFYFNGRGKRKGAGPEGLKDLDQEEFDFAYYLTVIPEKEAEYAAGFDALISYLKESSKEKTAIIIEEKLKPGRVNFTVTKEGSIANVILDSTCGYPTVDEALLELVRNIPGKWEPATDSKGEKVDQEFVFFFGLEGC